MRPCRYNPKLSAYSALEGDFSYNHAPLALLGSKIIAHDHTDGRQSWAPHGHYGWLVGPAMNHYRCFTIYNPKTKGTTIAYAIQQAESNRFQAPKITSTEQLTSAASELAKALNKSSTTILPDEPLKQNIDKLCTIFEKAVDNIAINKLAPLREEIAPSLDACQPPRVV